MNEWPHIPIVEIPGWHVKDRPAGTRQAFTRSLVNIRGSSRAELAITGVSGYQRHMAASQKKSGASPAAAGATTSPTAAQGETSRTGSAATRQAEIETKLEIDPAAKLPSLTKRRRLSAVGIVAAADPQSYYLDATYYDTADLDLLRSKMTLRRRTGGPDAGWHLKLPAVQGARTEVGLPLTAGEPGEIPAELAGIVRGAARGRDLRPVARLENERTVRHLLDEAGETMIEVADDHVTATPLIGAAKPSQWRELEAEIIRGNRDQLAATVDVLMSAGASKASSASKLARALSFAPSAAPRSKSAGAAVVAALGRQRDLLIVADRGLRDGVDGALHDARSAARRIRAMLTVYSPLFTGDTPPALRSVLRSFGSTLSNARDLDVAHRRLVAQLDEEPEEYARAARARLDDACGERLSAARAEARQMIDSPDYLQMLRDIDELVARPPLSRRGNRAASNELPELISASWARLRGQSDDALTDPDNAGAVHEARKSAKTVRYATEAAIGALGSDAVVFASALEEIQETLGEFQDAGYAANLLAELALDEATDGVAGFIFGRLHAFEQAIAHGAFDEFSDVWDRVEDGDLVAALGR
jgi:CHAD domain-containing protein